MVINDTEFSAEMDVDDVDRAFLSSVLHELAHILEHPALYESREGENPDRLKFEALALGCDVSEELSPSGEAYQVAYHGSGFMRMVLHLCHRANALGILIPPWQIHNTRQYSLSHPNHYRDALGDEPVRLAGASFKEISAIRLPKKFSRLWAEDVARRQNIVLTP